MASWRAEIFVSRLTTAIDGLRSSPQEELGAYKVMSYNGNHSSTLYSSNCLCLRGAASLFGAYKGDPDSKRLSDGSFL
jgi:hypothetical protein